MAAADPLKAFELTQIFSAVKPWTFYILKVTALEVKVTGNIFQN